MRQGYPSDVTREQYEVVKYIFETFRKTTCPRKYDLYDIFCAILYIVKEGRTWRGLPHDFPKWRIVYRYFQMWGTAMESGQSLFEQAMHELAMSERIIKGRNPQSSMVFPLVFPLYSSHISSPYYSQIKVDISYCPAGKKKSIMMYRQILSMERS